VRTRSATTAGARPDGDGPQIAAAGNGRPPVRRRRTAPSTVLAVASLGVFMAFVDATIVNIAFPDIARTFPDASLSGLSWVLNAYNIVFAAFLVAAGRIADLLGRRRVFLLGLIEFTLASGLCAVATSAELLTAFRVLQALGAALLVPASLGLVLEAFSADRRSHAVALLTAVGAVAAGIGPSLGGLLVSAGSWRLVFLVNVPVGVAAYVLSRRHLVESRAPGRRRLPDVVGATVLALAIGTLVLGVIKGGEWGWASPPILVCFAASVLLGALFAWRCRWHRSPIVDLALLRDRTFTTANAMSVLAAAGFYGYTLSNVLFLTGVWGYSVLEAGLAITPGPFVAAAVAGPSSRLAERYGHRVVLFAGGLVWAGAVVWLVLRVGTTPAFLEQWLPATCLLGIGAGITLPNLSGAAVASAPGEDFATATGLNSVARQIGAALGVAVAVALVGRPTSLEAAAAAFDESWWFAAGCLLAAGVGCLWIGRIGDGDDVSRSPSLALAARLVLPAPTPPVRAAAPRLAPLLPEPPAGAAPQPESVDEFLGRVPLLAGVPPELRQALAERARDVHVAAGEWLFRQGDDGDAMYVVRAGRLEILREDDGDTSVMVLGRGAALGELSLLTSSPRSASVRAARASDLIAIDREDFQRQLQAAPELALAMTRVLGEHLRASRPAAPEVRPLPSTITVLALDESVPVRDIAARLSAALGAAGRVALLDGGETAPPDPATTPASVYGPLLDRAERAHDRVVLVAAAAPGDPWTDFCVQQGDRLLALAGRGAPEDGAAQAALRGCDLVGHGVAQGSGTLAGWAAMLDPIETHSLSPGRSLDADVARLARRLSGQSLGIVLSGGGARAFSHIGVLEELTAAGAIIDRVGGVSMGAFIGAMHAAGMDADEMDARCYEEWVRRRPLGDYTLPRHGLIRGARVEAMLERVFGSVAIEELPRGFFAAAADLRSGRLVVSRWGRVAESVGLSLCMPLLAPPQVRGRQLLIDGSLVDNLPMATMAALGEGPIIAVDVKATFERENGTRPAPDELRTPAWVRR
jgi:NTE family protein